MIEYNTIILCFIVLAIYILYVVITQKPNGSTIYLLTSLSSILIAITIYITKNMEEKKRINDVNKININIDANKTKLKTLKEEINSLDKLSKTTNNSTTESDGINYNDKINDFQTKINKVEIEYNKNKTNIDKNTKEIQTLIETNVNLLNKYSNTLTNINDIIYSSVTSSILNDKISKIDNRIVKINSELKLINIEDIPNEILNDVNNLDKDINKLNESI